MTQVKVVKDQIHPHLSLRVTGLHNNTYTHRSGGECGIQHLQHQRTNSLIPEI